jgi:hypothetical protein
MVSTRAAIVRTVAKLSGRSPSTMTIPKGPLELVDELDDT